MTPPGGAPAPPGGAMKIASGCVVELEYKLHLDDGTLVDSSDPDDPLSYLHGTAQLVPGLERELEGLGKGERKQVKVSAKDGYGEHNPAGLQTVERGTFPADAELTPGMQFLA